MAKDDYLPNGDGDLTTWTSTFETELAANGPTLGVTPTEITNMTNAAKAIRTAIATAATKQQEAKQAVAAKNAQIATSFAIIRPGVKRAKTSANYTVAIGNAMGIVGTDNQPDWATYKPVLSAQVRPGHVDLFFEKKGVEAVNIYTRLKGQSAWQKLAQDRHAPYVDNRPGAVPGQSENREYMAIGVLNDNEIGQQSDIVSVVFAG